MTPIAGESYAQNIMPRKHLTIDDLAVMINAGFKSTLKHVDKRFDIVDGRMVNLESDASYLKSRVMEIGQILNRHEELLDEHSRELKWIHQRLDELTNPASQDRVVTHHDFVELESRVTALERKLIPRDR